MAKRRARAQSASSRAAEVRRSIFTDPGVYAREQERIFNRSWLYLAHVSEIPNPGDYVARPMGSDQVIVWRGEDRQIRVFLNACRHRGMQVCRADAGTARRFVCPYHAWTYDSTGKLRTTTYDQHYQPSDLKSIALTSAAQVSQYRGLIFATWNMRAGTLAAHLGDLRWYLDLQFGRTPAGMTVIGPPQRWIIETNWKIPALNFLDSQHALRTHVGPMTLAKAAGAPPLSEIIRMANATPQISFPQGHGVVLQPVSPNLPDFFGYPPDLVPLYASSLMPDQFAQLRHMPPGVGTIFPNTSWVGTLLAVAADEPPMVFLSLRNWQPLTANKLEVWSWYFADAEASDPWRARMHRIALQTFGVGGVFEEDDAEIWAAISRSIGGTMASREYVDFSAGRSVPAMKGRAAPGIAHPSVLTEHAQRGFIGRWQHMMRNGARTSSARGHARMGRPA